MKQTNSPRTVGAVDTSLQIIEALQELDTTTATRISDHLDLSTATVYNHLSTLKQRGYVIKDSYSYRLSLKFKKLGEEVNRNHVAIFEPATEVSRNLADQTGELVWVMVEEDGQGVFILKQEGKNAVDSGRYSVGNFCPLHCAAPGKAMMAYFSETKINRIISEHGLPAVTEHTITDRDGLMTELEKIRERGIAVSDQEGTVGTVTVAAPILSSKNEVLGALSISGPASRQDEDQFVDRMASLVKEHANIVQIKVVN